MKSLLKSVRSEYNRLFECLDQSPTQQRLLSYLKDFYDSQALLFSRSMERAQNRNKNFPNFSVEFIGEAPQHDPLQEYQDFGRQLERELIQKKLADTSSGIREKMTIALGQIYHNQDTIESHLKAIEQGRDLEILGSLSGTYIEEIRKEIRERHRDIFPQRYATEDLETEGMNIGSGSTEVISQSKSQNEREGVNSDIKKADEKLKEEQEKFEEKERKVLEQPSARFFQRYEQKLKELSPKESFTETDFEKWIPVLAAELREEMNIFLTGPVKNVAFHFMKKFDTEKYYRQQYDLFKNNPSALQRMVLRGAPRLTLTTVKESFTAAGLSKRPLIPKYYGEIALNILGGNNKATLVHELDHSTIQGSFSADHAVVIEGANELYTQEKLYSGKKLEMAYHQYVLMAAVIHLLCPKELKTSYCSGDTKKLQTKLMNLAALSKDEADQMLSGKMKTESFLKLFKGRLYLDHYLLQAEGLNLRMQVVVTFFLLRAGVIQAATAEQMLARFEEQKVSQLEDSSIRKCLKSLRSLLKGKFQYIQDRFLSVPSYLPLVDFNISNFMGRYSGPPDISSDGLEKLPEINSLENKIISARQQHEYEQEQRAIEKFKAQMLEVKRRFEAKIQERSNALFEIHGLMGNGCDEARLEYLMALESIPEKIHELIPEHLQQYFTGCKESGNKFYFSVLFIKYPDGNVPYNQMIQLIDEVPGIPRQYLDLYQRFRLESMQIFGEGVRSFDRIPTSYGYAALVTYVGGKTQLIRFSDEKVSEYSERVLNKRITIPSDAENMAWVEGAQDDRQPIPILSYKKNGKYFVAELGDDDRIFELRLNGEIDMKNMRVVKKLGSQGHILLVQNDPLIYIDLSEDPEKAKLHEMLEDTSPQGNTDIRVFLENKKPIGLRKILRIDQNKQKALLLKGGYSPRETLDSSKDRICKLVPAVNGNMTMTTYENDQVSSHSFQLPDGYSQLGQVYSTKGGDCAIFVGESSKVLVACSNEKMKFYSMMDDQSSSQEGVTLTKTEHSVLLGPVDENGNPMLMDILADKNLYPVASFATGMTLSEHHILTSDEFENPACVIVMKESRLKGRKCLFDPDSKKAVEIPFNVGESDVVFLKGYGKFQSVWSGCVLVHNGSQIFIVNLKAQNPELLELQDPRGIFQKGAEAQMGEGILYGDHGLYDLSSTTRPLPRLSTDGLTHYINGIPYIVAADGVPERFYNLETGSSFGAENKQRYGTDLQTSYRGIGPHGRFWSIEYTVKNGFTFLMKKTILGNTSHDGRADIQYPLCQGLRPSNGQTVENVTFFQTSKRTFVKISVSIENLETHREFVYEVTPGFRPQSPDRSLLFELKREELDARIAQREKELKNFRQSFSYEEVSNDKQSVFHFDAAELMKRIQFEHRQTQLKNPHSYFDIINGSLVPKKSYVTTGEFNGFKAYQYGDDTKYLRDRGKGTLEVPEYQLTAQKYGSLLIELSDYARDPQAFAEQIVKMMQFLQSKQREDSDGDYWIDKLVVTFMGKALKMPHKTSIRGKNPLENAKKLVEYLRQLTKQIPTIRITQRTTHNTKDSWYEVSDDSPLKPYISRVNFTLEFFKNSQDKETTQKNESDRGSENTFEIDARHVGELLYTRRKSNPIVYTIGLSEEKVLQLRSKMGKEGIVRIPPNQK
ncbi:MAG: hypothetical protein P1V18_00255 [Candidatus Gracilibacteria bacterium]|nr:hypothetical protein [Candidatus Gracilibacteria bacterium]